MEADSSFCAKELRSSRIQGEIPEEFPVRQNVLEERKEPERIDDFDSLAELFEAKPDLFVKVNEDSLELAGYRVGDVLVVSDSVEPRDGDVVVARIGSEVTIRQFFASTSGTIELRPASVNPGHRSWVFGPETDRSGEPERSWASSSEKL